MWIERSATSGLDEAEYSELIERSETAMFTHSWKYLSFLESLLPSASAHHLLCRQDGALIGALPVFTTQTDECFVANSLPFFGSHGGTVLDSTASESAHSKLLESFEELALSFPTHSATLIEPPDLGNARRHAPNTFTFSDSRIGQITEIPTDIAEGYTREKLLGRFEKRARNSVNRSLRGELTLSPADSEQSLDEVYAIHVKNMLAIGGTPKPKDFVSAVRKNFIDGDDYQLFVARDGRRIVAGLLVFYFKSWAEYFMPATEPRYRIEQPMSGLILLAMEAAIQRGKTRWNWGGTWKSQTGVHRFKRGFAARDIAYRYFTKLAPAEHWAPEVVRITREKNPFFYIAPER